LNAADLLGTGETRCQPTAFRVLSQYNKGQKATNDQDDNGDGDHGLAVQLTLKLFCKGRKVSAFYWIFDRQPMVRVDRLG